MEIKVNKVRSMPLPNDKRFLDLTGHTYGRLLVMGYAGKMGRGRSVHMWICQCECSTIKLIAGINLRSRDKPTRSCGCLSRELASIRTSTHRHARHGKRSPEWKAWSSLKNRCENSNNAAYDRYGARSITVCERWRNSFENFLIDMGERWSVIHSLERLDNDGPYAPWNCCWATASQQNNNRRSNRILTFDGQSMNVSQWERVLGFRKGLVLDRLRYGWTIDRALTQPVRGMGK